ncbi:cytochrome c oxidase assembly protein [Antarctobacter heliothermus]|uniref:Cytochrome c oxidase assembly protein n=1 Tax=Antarctobacter heliothermus TaxID=74033 RepID=A0A222E9X3_9RHOB|nr:cytochrome C oxidase assembly protein [Antarctobacter heliothermus]ASP23019.1 cytochrome c oxidase assembly protein [Antarctobacter heliothermus]MBT52270.1 cytochrome C oxidase assembly protein [Mameliella sp.]|tara:strand:- start:3868 stop:4038 length:171 start_codon:yes stop_codon:yes gene_type:complete
MSLSKQHELHKRRQGRNTGVGLVLAAFVVIILGLTYVKITQGGLQMQPEQGVSDGG